MKKLLAVIVSCIFVVGLVYISTTTSVIYNIASFIVNETAPYEEISINSWYFTKLNDNEKDIYKRMTTAVQNMEEKIVFLNNTKLSMNSIDRAYEAYLLDNPDIFYLENSIVINLVELPNLYKYEVTLNYTIKNKQELNSKKQEIDLKIDDIINTFVTENMSDFEKELVIHDYLASNIKYYEYEKKEDIPHGMHNVYNALINNEAVCDGFSKSFQVILNKLGIKCITLTGIAGENSHAWNKVKLGNAWYNVDVTSDTVSNKKYVNHVYFNIDDKTISKTHIQGNNYVLPESSASEFNYYTYLDYSIDKYEDLRLKLSQIISKNNTKLLEFKIINDDFSSQEIINKLYELNFNNYKENNAQKIEYYYQNDVYMFIKD